MGNMPRTARRLYLRLAMQNLLKRRARTILLVLAVALGSGAVFGALTLLRGIERSMTAGFHRLGADLLVVPEATMVNLTAALLTVQPTAETLDAHLADELARLPGVARAAPETLLRRKKPWRWAWRIDRSDRIRSRAISPSCRGWRPLQIVDCGVVKCCSAAAARNALAIRSRSAG